LLVCSAWQKQRNAPREGDSSERIARVHYSGLFARLLRPIWPRMNNAPLRFMIGLLGGLSAASVVAASPQAITTLAAAPAGPISLGLGQTRITLTGTEPPEATIKALGPERKVYLVFSGLHALEQPGVVYDVYLALPKTAAASPNSRGRFLAGTLNFFAASDLAPGRVAGTHPIVSVEVTGLVRRLAAEGLLSRTTDVTVLPDGVPARGSNPTIESVALVAQ
jgi:hypothetical protein